MIKMNENTSIRMGDTLNELIDQYVIHTGKNAQELSEKY